MKKSILSTHVLLFATFLIVTCQDQSVQFEQAPLNFLKLVIPLIKVGQKEFKMEAFS